MNLSMGGYLKLGSSGGVEAVFIVIPPAPIDPDLPMGEDIVEIERLRDEARDFIRSN